jgi:hypothetical protein
MGDGATFELLPMSSTFLPLPLLNLSPGVFQMDSTLKSILFASWYFITVSSGKIPLFSSPWRPTGGYTHNAYERRSHPHQWASITPTMPK